NTGSGASINSVGRAKSRGFEYSSGNAIAGAYSSGSASTNIFKHYLFDINMFTHLNVTSNTAFTTGETVTGSTSSATATVESISTQTAANATGISVANPGV
mgnify:CR=1